MAFVFVASSRLPTRHGEFSIHAFEDVETGKEHVALSMGDLANGQPALARLHSECLTGDGFGSLRCDCGPQLEAAMRQVAEAGHGVILYLRQEGRGIGLVNKLRAYTLQDGGLGFGETSAILLYVADKFPQANLAPLPTDPNRGRFLQWLMYPPTTIEPAMMEKRRGSEPMTTASGWGDYDRAMAALEGTLTPGKWLFGDQFTAADGQRRAGVVLISDSPVAAALLGIRINFLIVVIEHTG